MRLFDCVVEELGVWDCEESVQNAGQYVWSHLNSSAGFLYNAENKDWARWYVCFALPTAYDTFGRPIQATVRDIVKVGMPLFGIGVTHSRGVVCSSPAPGVLALRSYDRVHYPTRNYTPGYDGWPYDQLLEGPCYWLSFNPNYTTWCGGFL